MPARSSSKVEQPNAAKRARLVTAAASHQTLARPLQLSAEGRIGNRNKRASAFGKRAAAQFGDAVLGDHEVGLGARRCDDSVGQLCDYARTGAFAIGRLQ